MEDGEFIPEEGEFVPTEAADIRTIRNEGLVAEEEVRQEIVDRDHEQLQKLNGDCLPNGFVVDLPEKVALDLAQNKLDGIKRFWASMDPSQRRFFRDRYGHIGSLLDVEVEEKMLKAAIYFWDPSYRCFVFGKHDMVPTVEEYQDILRTEKADSKKIYWPRNTASWRVNLAKIMDWKEYEIERLVNGDKVSAGHVLKTIWQKRTTRKCRDMLALLIYGTVIFPKHVGYIDAGVVCMLVQVMQGADPAPAIVSETLRSLTYCRHNDARFFGCAQMLTIWFKSHIHLNWRSIVYQDDPDPCPIVHYQKASWPQLESEEEWIEFLRDLNEEYIMWEPRFLGEKTIPYLSADMPWIPLPGVWGVISYAPMMVRRQYGGQQTIPYTVGVDTVNLACFNENDFAVANYWAQKYRGADKVKVRKVNRYDEKKRVKPEYLHWHRLRRNNLAVPAKDILLQLNIQRGEDPITHLYVQYQRATDGTEAAELKEEIGVLTKKNLRLATEKEAVEYARKEVKKDLKRKEIELEMSRKEAQSYNKEAAGYFVSAYRRLKLLRESNKKLKHTSQSLKEEQEITDGLFFTCENLEKENKLLERRMAEERKLKEEMMKEFEQKLRIEREKVTQKGQELESEKKKNEQLAQEMMEMKQKSVMLEEELTKEKREGEHWIQMVAHLRQQITSLHSTATNARMNSVLQNQVQRLTTRLGALREEFENVWNTMQGYEESAERWYNRYSVSQAQLARLQELVEQVSNEAVAVRSRVEQVRATLGTAVETLANAVNLDWQAFLGSIENFCQMVISIAQEEDPEEEDSDDD